ncbi:hypothetical protein IC757_07190 [Wenzhouxiangella sp. AB-CW3]|nr:hypothetical protein [Wenzhouxiangella sp. AB-CW3]QOC23895.1 hypothetical protein IC757_07190 [Wenzhouxiangella sp. AB-CW3]
MKRWRWTSGWLVSTPERPKVAHIETQLIFRRRRNYELPVYLNLEEQ